MATIHITEDFKVEVDECNHTLYQYREGGEEVTVGKYKGSISKPKWEVVGYYPNLQQAIRKVIFLKGLTGNESLTLQECIDRLNIILGEIK